MEGTFFMGLLVVLVLLVLSTGSAAVVIVASAEDLRSSLVKSSRMAERRDDGEAFSCW